MNPILSPGIDIVQPSGAYLLRDEFSVDVAAGSVNGTAAVPGPGTRTVVDTGGKLSLVSGKLTVAGGTSPGDPQLYYSKTIARTGGRMLLWQHATWNNVKGQIGLALAPILANGAHIAAGLSDNAGTAKLTVNSAQIASFPTSSAAFVSVIIRQAGYVVFYKSSDKWLLEWVGNSGTTDPLYVGLGCRLNPFSPQIDFFRVPVARWLPTPLVSDGFGSAFGISDGLGHQEGIAGGIGAGGAGVVWSNAGNTWSVSGGKAINTPSVGSELLTDPGLEGTYTSGLCDGLTKGGSPTVAESADARTGLKAQSFIGNLANENTTKSFTATIGTWYKMGFYVKRTAGAQGWVSPAWSYGGELYYYAVISNASYALFSQSRRAVGTTIVQGIYQFNGNGGDTIVLDDLSVKAFTFPELLSLSNLACSDVMASVAIAGWYDDKLAGLALNWDSTTSPSNGILVYIATGTNSTRYITVDKCVAGTWSNVSTTLITYSAGARLVVAKNGTEYRTYYNNALVKADTITDAGIITNTLHGLFSTDASNTFDDYVAYATGSSGEYAALNAF